MYGISGLVELLRSSRIININFHSNILARLSLPALSAVTGDSTDKVTQVN